MNSRLESFAYALLRIVAGAMFTFHGVQKIFGVYSDKPSPAMWSQMWIGGVLELVLGAAIALGLFTSVAAFVASGEMAVAYFQFHWKLQGGPQFFPAVNGGELAVLYCFVFFFMAFRGSGPLSLDSLRKRRKGSASR